LGELKSRKSAIKYLEAYRKVFAEILSAVPEGDGFESDSWNALREFLWEQEETLEDDWMTIR
jgi:hypothetical protein